MASRSELLYTSACTWSFGPGLSWPIYREAQPNQREKSASLVADNAAAFAAGLLKPWWIEAREEVVLRSAVVLDD